MTQASRGITMQEATEQQLTARFRDGDLAAFSAVYAQYEPQVFRYAYHLLGHREDADDATQETFLRACQSLRNFRHDASLRTWLFAICGNICRDKIKSWERRNVVAELPIRDTPGTDNDPAEIVDRAATSEIIWKVLRGMPPTHREVIVLHEVEGLDYREIAEILGCSQAGVKLRVFRARRDLKARVTSLLQIR